MSPDETKPQKRVLVSYGVDIDAIAGWLGSYQGEDSTSDISRGRHDVLARYSRFPPLASVVANQGHSRQQH